MRKQCKRKVNNEDHGRDGGYSHLELEGRILWAQIASKYS